MDNQHVAKDWEKRFLAPFFGTFSPSQFVSASATPTKK
jgi:hypothetical protein